jgi:hypothetical protein
MEKELSNEIAQTAGQLLQVVDGFTQDAFNAAPFEGSWTPGQVVEHIALYASGVLRTVEGATAPTERDPAKMVAPMRNAFLDFDTKMQSPDFIIPSNKAKEKVAAMKSLSDSFAGLARVAANEDLHVTCLGFSMPTVGQMTRLEWISFVVVHTRRHIWQLKKMAVIAGSGD